MIIKLLQYVLLLICIRSIVAFLEMLFYYGPLLVAASLLSKLHRDYIKYRHGDTLKHVVLIPEYDS
jgi:hypothetical protein